ncbi:phosphopantetheine-binding protein [Lachnoclostridium phytofermentans]|uniref:Phosphopantetheine-binding n=1 Tax=Lachnoclostridium phytofermentans (strain ATCC 700394 / DSM 18823 / ISDg) TaxID=357809 RepID=A9KJZ6_LACP7|nr:phosphopantetheine-binding protein [Lachnoclostridium phytofermentans]ABX42568.1 phosphopantetheine-binding [Lachnoclostridium phytofermentans ISDg]
MVATIWKEVLGYDTFSIHDSFFDMGGDSLKIRSVYFHIEKLLPGKITIVDLFTYSTIFQLAKFLDDNNNEKINKTNKLSDELHNLVTDLKDGKQSLEEIIERYNHLQ